LKTCLPLNAQVGESSKAIQLKREFPERLLFSHGGWRDNVTVAYPQTELVPALLAVTGRTEIDQGCMHNARL